MSRLFFIPMSLLVFLSLVHPASATESVKWFRFGKQATLKDWKEKIFKGKVKYEIVDQGELGSVRATSSKAASGLYYELEYAPEEYPWLSWKWKVDKFPNKKGKPEDEKDDFAARIYVVFPAFFFAFSTCLEYVWDDELKEGTILDSPWSSNIKVMVLKKGKKGEWLSEERNLLEDYRKAFDDDPDDVGAVAFMTDTENTQSDAVAYYRDIRVGYQKESK